MICNGIICLGAKIDGIICAEDQCDIEAGLLQPYQYDTHIHAYLDDLIDRTEAASVAHVFGTYY